MPKLINISELNEHRLHWKSVNLNVLNDEDRHKYSVRKRAVDLYIDGYSPANISTRIGVSSSEIIRLVHKCTQLDSDGRMIGYEALLPFNRLNSGQTKLEKLFLQYPSLEDFILGNYYSDKKYTLEKNMSIKRLVKKFNEECVRLGVPDYEFPFTSKDKGYYVINQYIKEKEKSSDEIAMKRMGKNAQKHYNSTGIGYTNSISPIYPYNVVQVDGHKIDMLYSVPLENEQGEIIRMVADRVWLITIIDVATRVIVGYSLSPNENYNQYDVLQAIYNAIVPHKNISFTKAALFYPENGGFPSTYIPNSEWALFDTIMFDNAKAHLAKSVKNKLIETLQCTVNVGPVATPEVRGIVERFFKTIEDGGFHRLPGTTGSNISDIKRNNAEREATSYEIEYTDICELVEYLIAQYNNSAHSKLENQTPLQVMKRRINAGVSPYIVPPSDRLDIEKLTHITIERTLRGGYKTGQRPHFSYLGVKYHALDIAIPMDYIGKKVYIDVDPADVSHIDVYDNKGRFLAKTVAVGEWGRRSHSIKTREAAMARRKKNGEENQSFSPDLTAYENELRKNAKKSRRCRTKAAALKREYISGSQTVSEKIEIEFDNTQAKEVDVAKLMAKMRAIDSMSIEEAFEKGLI